jgi:hypothetical protein
MYMKKRRMYIGSIVVGSLFLGGVVLVYIYGENPSETQKTFSDKPSHIDNTPREKESPSEEKTSSPKETSRDFQKEDVVNEFDFDPLETFVDHEVPFTSQAPLAQWNDPIFQNACEEASLLMAERFALKSKQSFNPENASNRIRTLTEEAEKLFGEHRDISTQDSLRLGREALDLDMKVRQDISAEEIVRTLHRDAVVILAMDGRTLNNPHFTPPGPQYHMVLVRGYDPEGEEFIVNDPGTRYGEGYRYKEEIFMEAVQDYETGYHGKVFPEKKDMIVVELSEEAQ